MMAVCSLAVASSRYERMRTDPANWKLGLIYFCPDDPRVVVRQRFPIGWTWNFGNPRVVPTIVMAVMLFAAPAFIGWWVGVRSIALLMALLGIGLILVMFIAHRLSRDPGE